MPFTIYKNTKVIIKNYLTNENILNRNFILSTSYKAQKQYSETIKLETKSVEDLLNQTYQELIIKLSERISAK